MKFIKIARNGSGWGGIYRRYVCIPFEDHVSVKAFDLPPSMEDTTKEYDLKYNVFLKYLFDKIPDCSCSYTGHGVMDAQDDRVYRVNDDDSEDLIFQTEGAPFYPDDLEIAKMLSVFINVLSLVDSSILQVDNNNELYVYDNGPVNDYVWFNAKRCILANYCDSPMYAHTTCGPHCDNCLLQGMSSCRFLDHPRSKDHIDDEVIDRCYDRLMSYTDR